MREWGNGERVDAVVAGRRCYADCNCHADCYADGDTHRNTPGHANTDSDAERRVSSLYGKPSDGTVHQRTARPGDGSLRFRGLHVLNLAFRNLLVAWRACMRLLPRPALLIDPAEHVNCLCRGWRW